MADNPGSTPLAPTNSAPASGVLRPRPGLAPPVRDVRFLPILDVARGGVAGYQVDNRLPEDARSTDLASDDPDGRHTAELIRAALDASTSMPVNTFLTIPVSVSVAATRRVLGALLSRPRLDGVVVDLSCSVDAVPSPDLKAAVDRYREAGALIAVGGQGTAQPCLNGLVNFKPSFLRLTRDWIRGIDTSTSKRSALEVVGRLATHLGAWVFTEGVCSAAELRVLAGVGVPLAQGPFIGSAETSWSSVEINATRALPKSIQAADGSPLNELMQAAYTATDPAVAVAVLTETTGFDTVVIVDDHGRPRTLLETSGSSEWETTDVTAVNVQTSPNDAAQRALARPRPTRFTPLVCTDDTGRFVGILRIERLMSHLAGR